MQQNQQVKFAVNFKGAIIALTSIIVAMVGFTLKTLISTQTKTKIDVHENTSKITVNKTNIDNLNGRVDRRCK